MTAQRVATIYILGPLAVICFALYFVFPQVRKVIYQAITGIGLNHVPLVVFLINFFVFLTVMNFTDPKNESAQFIRGGLGGTLIGLAIFNAGFIGYSLRKSGLREKKSERLIIVIYVFFAVWAFDLIFGLGEDIPNFIQVATFIVVMLAFLFGVQLPGADGDGSG